MTGAFMARADAAQIAAIAALSIALVAGAFYLQGDIGLTLSEEGHLWYVTERTALGDVPVRDFRGYEPGRYYLGALWFNIFGRGILGLRAALAAVTAVGLVCGLSAFRTVTRARAIVPVMAVLLFLWIAPPYKAYETAVPLSAICVALALTRRPEPRRFFMAGLFVGFAGFIRIDHALYAAITFAALAVMLGVNGGLGRPRPLLIAAGAGIVVGYSPMLLMMLVVPGFFGGFVEHLAYLARLAGSMGDTNLPKAIPWPWFWSRYAPLVGPIEGLRLFLFGLLMVTLPLLYLAGGVRLAGMPRSELQRHAALLAAVATGAPYLHYAFSRPDIEHVAPATAVALIAGAALIGSFDRPRRRWAAAVALPLAFVISYATVGRQSPYLQKASTPGSWVKTDVGRDALWLPRGTAAFLGTLSRVNRELVSREDEILIAPFWPGLYAVLERRAPLWETYFLAPETEERQRRIIERLRDRQVNWALIWDVALDDREASRFRNTHRVVWEHLAREFEIVPVDGLPTTVSLLRRRDAIRNATR
jgi:hypothetical protein